MQTLRSLQKHLNQPGLYTKQKPIIYQPAFSGDASDDACTQT